LFYPRAVRDFEVVEVHVLNFWLFVAQVNIQKAGLFSSAGLTPIPSPMERGVCQGLSAVITFILVGDYFVVSARYELKRWGARESEAHHSHRTCLLLVS
jgi:hypothetical protein